MQRNWHFRRRFVAVRGPTDVTAPTLSAPVALPLGDTTGYLAVITNEANGTLYWVLTTSATPPSAAQVKAGQDNTGAAAAASGNQAVSAIGYQLITATGLTSNTAYYAYFMQEDVVGNQSNVSASSTFTTLTTGTSDTSFDNLIAAMSVAPNNYRKANIAQLIQQLYASGTWAKTDVFWVLAAHDEQAARLNWKSPGTFTLTAINSPTFTTDRGFNGDGSTSYLDTGWDRATNGVQFTQNNAHASVYQRTGTGLTLGIPASAALQISGATGTSGGGRLNNGSGTLGATAGGTQPLQIILRRTISTSAECLRDGVQVSAGGGTTGALSTSDLAFLRTSGGGYTTSQCAGGSLGANFDDTEALAFYTAWNAYMVAVGADT